MTVRREVRAKVAWLGCLTGTAALLVAVTAQAYLNNEVETRWKGYGLPALMASDGDISTGSIVPAGGIAPTGSIVASASDCISGVPAAPGLPEAALTPSRLLQSQPARRAPLSAIALEHDQQCPGKAPPAEAAAGARGDAATDEDSRITQVTVTRAGARSTVYMVLRENAKAAASKP